MNLALTSDLPTTANQMVFDLMRNRHPQPRIAWIAPLTSTGREHFPLAQSRFSEYGFFNLEYCDIDKEPNEMQLSTLDQYDVIYLSGGDPIRFQRNILKIGISIQLRKCLDVGCLVVAASGGSMQMTKNVSLFRLVGTPLDKVLAEHSAYKALGIVDYEILPHVNRLESTFLEKVRRYSEEVPDDIIGLADGAALIYTNSDDFLFTGQVTRFRKREVNLMKMG